MIDNVFIHYIVIGLTVVVTSLSVGIGQGLVSAAACQAINIQPEAKDDISNTVILCTALMEAASIIGVFIAVLLYFEPTTAISEYAHLAQLGIGFAICLSGGIVGLISAFPAQQACFAIARQPFAASWIFRFTIMILSIMQTPLIFALIIALFIKFQALTVTTLAESLRLIGAGCAIGIGTLGPVIGMGLVTRSATHGVGINRQASNQILSFTFLSQTILETPIVFSLLTALLLLTYSSHDSLIAGVAMLAAGLCIGLGTISPGINAGRVARAGVQQLSSVPDAYNRLIKMSIFAQGFIDTNAIYALVVSILLILVI